jgi:putative ABC transport system permease protein
MQTQRVWIGLSFAAGLGAVFVVLAATAKGVVWLTRKVVTARMPFVIRQGVASLHRPNNPTLLLLLSLGLGTFLMTSLYLVQGTLMTQLISTKGTNQPNAVLFDIQAGQKEAARKLVQSLNLPVLDETPIITMRLSSVKGVAVESIMSKTNRSGESPRWAYRREYRSTYSDHLRDGERLVSGQWIPQVPAATSPVPISLEEEIAKTLKVGLGDELVFDIQGIPMTTKVASLREVEWRRIQPNFFVVFPRGVLEEAPAMNVLVTRVESSEESARMQREVVKAFPNVSVIDLTLVLQSVNGILTKISFVIRFMAMFTVLTGLFVLVSTLLTSRYQRMQESVLLRTLGASRAQIFRILAVEYAAIGLLSALTGVFLAVIAAAALAKFVFLTPFALQIAPLPVALLLVPSITVVTGLLMSRGVLNHPPLAILRSE